MADYSTIAIVNNLSSGASLDSFHKLLSESIFTRGIIIGYSVCRLMDTSGQ